MGKRGKRRANYLSDDSYYSDEELSDGSEVGEYVKPWTLIVQECDDELMEVHDNFKGRDDLFKWLGIGYVLSIVQNYLENPRLKKLGWKVNAGPKTFPPLCEYRYLEPILYDYVGILHDLYALSDKPILDGNEEEMLIPVKNYPRFRDYMVYKLLKYRNQYIM